MVLLVIIKVRNSSKVWVLCKGSERVSVDLILNGILASPFKRGVSSNDTTQNPIFIFVRNYELTAVYLLQFFIAFAQRYRCVNFATDSWDKSVMICKWLLTCLLSYESINRSVMKRSQLSKHCYCDFKLSLLELKPNVLKIKTEKCRGQQGKIWW